MFTGIVAAMGRITRIEKREGGVRLGVSASRLGMDDIAVGDSIAVNGVCLTVVTRSAASFDADVSAETLACTTGLDATGDVNLEKSLRLSDRLGGHLVSGHVDGIAEVLKFERAGESMLLRVRAPEALTRYIAKKGSVALQGVSLTVNEVQDAEFEVNLIPHTVSVTTLRHLKAGSKVNLEVDMIARYVERMLGAS
ncbi:MAG: riboflavin synthase subunit alpha [Betaproteobacteria bacterium RIFCSPLOWO2_02_FULL_62_17]|nr:MAG: riboflavin synthase subunit alpha [Betaproteobacteria bacterium RIFCSPLOWO2_02_FULL_62_17]